MKRPEAQAGVAEMLKVCPVCNALNSTDKMSCYNCSWHGTFKLDPAIIAASMDEIDPEVLFAMGAGLTPQSWRERLRERLQLFWTALKHKLSYILSIRRSTPV